MEIGNFSLFMVYLVFYTLACVLYKGRKDISSYAFKTFIYYPVICLLIAFPSFGIAVNALAFLFQK